MRNATWDEAACIQVPTTFVPTPLTLATALVAPSLPKYIEHHKKVGLRRVARKPIVLPQKSEKLGRRPVVPQGPRVDPLVLTHVFKQKFALTRALQIFTDVEVKDAQRRHFGVV
uniref:Uncharacterized protein n=1 Tax=Strombidinopsis acuminata TaxID=141414 RepID=A0A7S3VVC3_9SPIT|eukprot:scaffold75873_cov30-Tisochrysis_lutea.AAC.1